MLKTLMTLPPGCGRSRSHGRTPRSPAALGMVRGLDLPAFGVVWIGGTTA
jgi:hypothetical protein